MKSKIKSVIKKIFPQSILDSLRRFAHAFRTIEKLKTQRIFAEAADTPSYLDINALETLQRKYPFPPEYGYDAKSLEDRGITRAKQILRLPRAQEATSFLELGCWDGMVSCMLHRKGKKATAIDNRDAGFEKKASREGVNLLQMDAANMQFEDESFDFVFSYDAFEHFASPEDVLREAIRVVRKRGYIYLEFGPLYYSPLGEHAYRSITVPYCQFLFPKKTLNDFCDQKGLDPIDFSHVNGWSFESYRKLWRKYSYILETVRYNQSVDLSHLSLIREFPSCFKSKSNYFDNFIVTSLRVLFQKLDQELPNSGMNSGTKI